MDWLRLRENSQPDKSCSHSRWGRNPKTRLYIHYFANFKLEVSVGTGAVLPALSLMEVIMTVCVCARAKIWKSGHLESKPAKFHRVQAWLGLEYSFRGILALQFSRIKAIIATPFWKNGY